MNEMCGKNLITEDSGTLTNVSFYYASTFLKLNKANSGKNDDKGNKGSSRNETATESGKTAVVFSLKNEVGGLVKALRLFQVNVKYHYIILKVTMCLVTNLLSALKHF